VKASQGGKPAEVPVAHFNPSGGPPLEPDTFPENGIVGAETK